jgi:hypothetical protein
MPSKLTRTAYFLYSGVFLFFLFYSAPHRVHHLFEQNQWQSRSEPGDHHKDNDRRLPVSNSSNCVFQAAANGCQLLLVALIQFFSPSVILADLTVPVDSAIRQRFLPHAFQIRAPPQA